MTVGELEELLALLPEDMAVVVISDEGARHVTEVDKCPSRPAAPAEHRAGLEAGWGPGYVEVDGRTPPMLVLRATRGAPLWWQAFGTDVEFTVSGRWPGGSATTTRRRRPATTRKRRQPAASSPTQ